MKIKGILHIGAHECEDDIYTKKNLFIGCDLNFIFKKPHNV